VIGLFCRAEGSHTAPISGWKPQPDRSLHRAKRKGEVARLARSVGSALKPALGERRPVSLEPAGSGSVRYRRRRKQPLFIFSWPRRTGRRAALKPAFPPTISRRLRC